MRITHGFYPYFVFLNPSPLFAFSPFGTYNMTVSTLTSIAAATGLVLAARSRRARPHARRREEAMRRACRDEERAQAERVRAEAEAKTAALCAKEAQQREQAKIQNYLQSKAALEAMLQNPALSEAEKARIREEAKTKGLASAFTLAHTAAESAARQQDAAHRGEKARIERMETKEYIAQLEKNLKSHFRRPADDQPPPDAVIIPPLTNEQSEAMKNWSTAAQVATYAITAGIGAGVGAIIGIAVGGVAGGVVGGVVGAMLGAGWGAYEALCIASVQDEFDEAHQQGSSITVWRDGWKFNVDGNNHDGFYTQANGPLSVFYVAATTWMLTGRIP